MKAKETVLLVVDTQAAVVANAHETGRVVERILEAERRAREAGALVAWVQHEDENLVKGSAAWKLADGLEPKEGDLLVAKRYNSSFEETGLDGTLRERGIRTVVLAGAVTNWCIRATAYGALEHGFDLVLLGDAHTARDLKVEGDRTIPARDLIAELNVGIAGVEYPGRTASVIKTADLAF